MSKHNVVIERNECSQAVSTIRDSVLVQAVDASNFQMYCLKRNRRWESDGRQTFLVEKCGGMGRSVEAAATLLPLVLFGPKYPAPSSDARTT
jgi:hypothetical protein